MYFRFASAILLVVFVAMLGIELDKRVLRLRREQVRQHYQTEVLMERHARLRLKTERMAAPLRLLNSVGPDTQPRPIAPSADIDETLPLMLWRGKPRTADRVPSQ